MDSNSKLKGLLLIVSILILGLLVGCITLGEQRAYYRRKIDIEQIRKVRQVLTIITTIAEIEEAEGKSYIEKKEGLGIRLGNQYILALTHVTKFRNYDVVRTPMGFLTFPQKVLSEKYFIGKQKIRRVGRKGDISLFKARSYAFAKPIPFGDSDRLEEGIEVVVIGYSGLIDFNVKSGEVSLVDIPREKYPKYAGFVFITTAPINPGDSGAPVLAYNNKGQLEIIGIAAARYSNAQGMGAVYKINYVKGIIEELKTSRGE
jgi:S1-C subfamily serine protease